MKDYIRYLQITNKMKKILFLMFLGVVFSSCAPTPTETVDQTLKENIDYVDHSTTYDGESLIYDESMWYVNELKDVPLPDPHVYVEDHTYYIVGTSDRDINVVDCYSTTDFINYTFHKAIYNPKLYNGWEDKTKPEVYAPEIYSFDGKYYMYYSANKKMDNGSLRRYNSVVVSDNILGPYEPIVNDEVNGLKNPIFDYGDYRALDATIFVDDDNQMYMYYVITNVSQYIVGVKLEKPYKADWSTYKELIKPGYVDSSFNEQLLDWELYRDSKIKIAEAPYMLKSNNKYYLTYSVNGCWNKYYNVCYAVSDSPLGNYVKPYEVGKTWTNLLLGYPGDKDEESLLNKQWTGFHSGTGHHAFFYADDELMIAYHAHQKRTNNGSKFTERYLAIDHVYFDSDGVPFCNGPTYSIQPLPSSISGYKNVVNSANIKCENVSNIDRINDNKIVDYYNLSTKFDEVILGNGKSVIEIELDDYYQIGGIMIYGSAFYDSIFTEIDLIEFGTGEQILYTGFPSDLYINSQNTFVYPCSAFSIEVYKNIETNKLTFTFNLPNGGNINEIVILGK